MICVHRTVDSNVLRLFTSSRLLSTNVVARCGSHERRDDRAGNRRDHVDNRRKREVMIKGEVIAIQARRATALVIAGTVMFALSACTSGTASSLVTGGSQPSPSVGPPSTLATPVSPADQAKQDALAAYRDMWHNFVVAGQTSDWQSPLLGQYATGLALSTLSRGLYADHYNGLVSKGAPALNPVAVSVDPASNPSTVIINDCGDSTHALKYYANNGQPANDGPGGRRFIKATVQKQPDGSWKVSDFGIQPVGSC